VTVVESDMPIVVVAPKVLVSGCVIEVGICVGAGNASAPRLIMGVVANVIGSVLVCTLIRSV